jgi:hypothetical protein
LTEDDPKPSRPREALRFLPLAIMIFLGSRLLFDLLAQRPMFWSSQESFIAMLWSGLISGPFILFALMVAAQRNTGK